MDLLSLLSRKRQSVWALSSDNASTVSRLLTPLVNGRAASRKLVVNYKEIMPLLFGSLLAELERLVKAILKGGTYEMYDRLKHIVVAVIYFLQFKNYKLGADHGGDSRGYYLCRLSCEVKPDPVNIVNGLASMDILGPSEKIGLFCTKGKPYSHPDIPDELVEKVLCISFVEEEFSSGYSTEDDDDRPEEKMEEKQFVCLHCNHDQHRNEPRQYDKRSMRNHMATEHCKKTEHKGIVYCRKGCGNWLRYDQVKQHNRLHHQN